jgi:hypothetical protein
MALIKMGTAARRARAGSTNTLRRALLAAGVPLVTLSPGTWAVEEQDLNRFLETREHQLPAPPPKKPWTPTPPASTAGKTKTRKRRQ